MSTQSSDGPERDATAPQELRLSTEYPVGRIAFEICYALNLDSSATLIYCQEVADEPALHEMDISQTKNVHTCFGKQSVYNVTVKRRPPTFFDVKDPDFEVEEFEMDGKVLVFKTAECDHPLLPVNKQFAISQEEIIPELVEAVVKPPVLELELNTDVGGSSSAAHAVEAEDTTVTGTVTIAPLSLRETLSIPHIGGVNVVGTTADGTTAFLELEFDDLIGCCESLEDFVKYVLAEGTRRNFKGAITNACFSLLFHSERTSWLL